MDQYSNNKILLEILAKPAGNLSAYVNDLQKLVQENPQSGLLHALAARAGLHNASNPSTYFDSRVLYKVAHRYDALLPVSPEQIIGNFNKSAFTETAEASETPLVFEDRQQPDFRSLPDEPEALTVDVVEGPIEIAAESPKEIHPAEEIPEPLNEITEAPQVASETETLPAQAIPEPDGVSEIADREAYTPFTEEFNWPHITEAEAPASEIPQQEHIAEPVAEEFSWPSVPQTEEPGTETPAEAPVTDFSWPQRNDWHPDGDIAPAVEAPTEVTDHDSSSLNTNPEAEAIAGQIPEGPLDEPAPVEDVFGSDAPVEHVFHMDPVMDDEAPVAEEPLQDYQTFAEDTVAEEPVQQYTPVIETPVAEETVHEFTPFTATEEEIIPWGEGFVAAHTTATEAPVAEELKPVPQDAAAVAEAELKAPEAESAGEEPDSANKFPWEDWDFSVIEEGAEVKPTESAEAAGAIPDTVEASAREDVFTPEPVEPAEDHVFENEDPLEYEWIVSQGQSFELDEKLLDNMAAEYFVFDRSYNPDAIHIDEPEAQASQEQIVPEPLAAGFVASPEQPALPLESFVSEVPAEQVREVAEPFEPLAETVEDGPAAVETPAPEYNRSEPEHTYRPPIFVPAGPAEDEQEGSDVDSQLPVRSNTFSPIAAKHVKLDISRYNDEKMPYSFMWWLDKTRREHGGLYQPFASAELPITPPKQETGIQTPVKDELQHQYYESIFNLNSIEEINKNNPAPPNEIIQERKEDLIIKRFIQEGPHISPPVNEKLDTENKAKKSSEDSNEIVTETLARIYTDQMLYTKAIATYKKLMLKYPEKSRYFASQIKNLENKTN